MHDLVASGHKAMAQSQKVTHVASDLSSLASCIHAKDLHAARQFYSVRIKNFNSRGVQARVNSAPSEDVPASR
jgi:hypothetical protein